MFEKQSTAKGFAILGLAGIINKIFAVIYVPILTLIIDDFGNGIYNAGYMMYLLVFVITNTGIPIAISKLVSEQIALGNHKDAHRTLEISGVMLIALGFITSVLTAVFARWLSNAVGWPEAYLIILALSPTMFFTAISGAFRGYFQGRSNMFPTGVSQIIEQLLNSILTIVFAWVMLKYGVQYAITHGIHDENKIRLISLEFAAAGGTVGTSVGAMGSVCFLIILYLKSKRSILKEIQESLNLEVIHKTSKEIAQRVLKYAIPITLGSVAVYTANLIDLKYTKSRLISAGFSQYDASSLYGILTTQYQKILNIPLSVAAALAAAIIPTVSAAAAIKDINSLSRKINESFKAILMVTIPAAIGLAILAKPIITVLFPRNVHGWDLMMIGSGVLVLISVVQIQTAILQGIGKTHLPTIHMIMALIIKIIINYNLIAVKSINIKGAVIGSAVCYCFAGVLNHISIMKYTKVSLAYKKVLNRPLIASLLMGVIVIGSYKVLEFLLHFLIPSSYLLNLVSLMIAILVGFIIFFISMIYIKGITPEDIKRLPMGNKINNYINRYSFFH